MHKKLAWFLLAALVLALAAAPSLAQEDAMSLEDLRRTIQSLTHAEKAETAGNMLASYESEMEGMLGCDCIETAAGYDEQTDTFSYGISIQLGGVHFVYQRTHSGYAEMEVIAPVWDARFRGLTEDDFPVMGATTANGFVELNVMLMEEELGDGGRVFYAQESELIEEADRLLTLYPEFSALDILFLEADPTFRVTFDEAQQSYIQTIAEIFCAVVSVVG